MDFEILCPLCVGALFCLLKEILRRVLERFWDLRTHHVDWFLSEHAPVLSIGFLLTAFLLLIIIVVEIVDRLIIRAINLTKVFLRSLIIIILFLTGLNKVL